MSCLVVFRLLYGLNTSSLNILLVICSNTLGLIVVNIETLQSAENGCHVRLGGLICVDTLVMFEQLFKVLDVSILVVDDLVEGFDVTFFMFRQLGGIGMLLCDSETPVFVTQRIVAGESGFSDGCCDLGCGIPEEEESS